ncbi:MULTISPECIES: dihydropteroate synthase [unclassified Nocardia]|uniref:dihydropteroate synthase n=1 Tax=unclassified Nocardia TaxID=2637762 RepID=UPI001CE3D541|nr:MULTISPECIES: dihydropteroate synthase [unclassified Nocardia]
MADLSRYYSNWPVRFVHDIKIVGVINTSPDSYVPESVVCDIDQAVAAARRHIQQGAHYVEVGGLSGGSAARRVSEQEEMDRTLPIVEAIAAEFPQVALTVDTFRPAIAKAALRVGAWAINDVTAMTFDEAMIGIAAEHRAQVFLMHLEGPGGHQGRKLNRPHFDDVVGEIKEFFVERIDTLTAAGIERDKIVIDVGLGAGKRPFHDYELLARLSEFSELGVAQMSACSRKQFVEAVCPVPPAERLGGSIVGSLWSVLAGCRYLRVHEVRPYAQMLDVWNAIMSRVPAACE